MGQAALKFADAYEDEVESIKQYPAHRAKPINATRLLAGEHWGTAGYGKLL
jgi:hypothetical protein